MATVIKYCPTEYLNGTNNGILTILRESGRGRLKVAVLVVMQVKRKWMIMVHTTALTLNQIVALGSCEIHGPSLLELQEGMVIVTLSFINI